MQSRINFSKVAPGALRAMFGLEQYVNNSGLEPSLLDLIKTRASQLNGCAYCIDMHTKDARAHGEGEQRLYALSVWRATPFYSERERAALDWTEAITLIGQTHAPDDVFAAARAQFSEEELVNLTVAIIAINGWNRLATGFRETPGTYQPRSQNQA